MRHSEPNTEAIELAIAQAAQWLQQADGLLICAGAGMGVDSGLPDFRGTKGFWQAYPALEHTGLDFYSMANPVHFERQPQLAWGFYGHRLGLYRATVPHVGFDVLRSWGERLPHGAFVFTSNVDGQFQKSGFTAEHVMECHGSIHYLQCSAPCHDGIWSAKPWQPEVDMMTCTVQNELPMCPKCGAVARPNILMFGDGQWLVHRTAQQQDALHQWLSRVRRPLVVEIGAGTAVSTVRRFAESVCRNSASSGAGRLLRINPDDAFQCTTQQIVLPLSALHTLQTIENISE